MNYFFEKLSIYSSISVLFIFSLFFFVSSLAFSQNMVKFNVDSPELLTTEGLKDFLVKTDKPKIVVRYSTFDYNESQVDLDYLYMMSGF